MKKSSKGSKSSKESKGSKGSKSSKGRKSSSSKSEEKDKSSKDTLERVLTPLRSVREIKKMLIRKNSVKSYASNSNVLMKSVMSLSKGNNSNRNSRNKSVFDIFMKPKANKEDIINLNDSHIVEIIKSNRNNYKCINSKDDMELYKLRKYSIHKKAFNNETHSKKSSIDYSSLVIESLKEEKQVNYLKNLKQKSMFGNTNIVIQNLKKRSSQRSRTFVSANIQSCTNK